MAYNAIDGGASRPMVSGMSAPAAPTRTGLWFRLLLPGGALGPGKIALMRAVIAEGSVSGAARALRMSHARSVKLVAELNALAPTPLIDTRAGGPTGGGASVTPLGLAVLDAYAGLDIAVQAAAGPKLAALTALLEPQNQAGLSTLGRLLPSTASSSGP